MAGQDHSPSTTNRKVGRRAGESGTRGAILTAALEMFSEAGYDATSVRAIAKAAEVDPGLVRHYFGTKQQLFTSAIIDRSDLGAGIAEALSGPADGIGERLVRTYLSFWESPETGPVMQTLFRSAVTSAEMAPLFTRAMLSNVRDLTVDGPTIDRIRRLPLIAPQIMGVVVGRYVLNIPALTEEPLEDLVARLAPEVQRALEE